MKNNKKKQVIYIDDKGKMHDLEIEEFRLDLMPPVIEDTSKDGEISLRSTWEYVIRDMKVLPSPFFLGIDFGKEDAPRSKNTEEMDF